MLLQSRSNQDLGKRNGLRLRRLGRTELLVAELGLGGHFTAGPTKHEDVDRRVRELNYTLDKGINYWDVQWEIEHEVSAMVLRERGDEVVVAWGLHGVDKRLQEKSLTAQYVVDYCHDHRQRYGLEHVNILLAIAVGAVPEGGPGLEPLLEGFEVVKQAGWADFLAFSCHESPEVITDILQRYPAFDVAMFPYNFLYPRAEDELFGLANRLDVGIVTIKPCVGAYKGGLLCDVYAGVDTSPELAAWRESGRPFQAALQRVLRSPFISTTVPGMHSEEEIDEMIAAAQAEWWPENEEILESYQRRFSELPVEPQYGAAFARQR